MLLNYIHTQNQIPESDLCVSMIGTGKSDIKQRDTYFIGTKYRDDHNIEGLKVIDREPEEVSLAEKLTNFLLYSEHLCI